MSPALDNLPTLILSLILEGVWILCSSQPLVTLPALILIIDHIAQIHQSSPKTLWSLARVNKACYHATTPLLYRNLALLISSHQKLQEDCIKLEEQPFCKRFLTYDRCLKISGRMPLREENEERAPRSVENYEPGDTEEYKAEFRDVFATDLSDESAKKVFKVWNPLAVVIQKCRHISDLIWVWTNQLPRCVFQAIT